MPTPTLTDPKPNLHPLKPVLSQPQTYPKPSTNTFCCCKYFSVDPGVDNFFLIPCILFFDPAPSQQWPTKTATSQHKQERAASAQKSVWTHQNTEGKPDKTMANPITPCCSTQRARHEQICNPQQWFNSLLPRACFTNTTSSFWTVCAKGEDASISAAYTNPHNTSRDATTEQGIVPQKDATAEGKRQSAAKQSEQ